MTPLEPPDNHHLLAVVGWLELGNPTEANEELARLSPKSLDHVEVLEVRWMVCAATASWGPALEVATRLHAQHPERDSGWLHRAYALRRVAGGGLEQAWEALRPAYEKFPKTSPIPFNLACYATQLGRLADAWEWLHRAMEAEGDVDRIKKMAMADKDLEPLWSRNREL